MAHEVENMFSVLETPWHGLGVILQQPPTTREAIVVAGLDWSVEKLPLHLADGRRVDAFATVRSSDGAVLGTQIGAAYTVLQNRDVFGWFDPFLASGEATLETAGSLRGGSVVWALARLTRGDSVIVKAADDVVAKYILLSSSHDGSTGACAALSPIRVVCANTLAMALEDRETARLTVRHTAGIHASLEAIRDCINVADRKFEATAVQYRRLAQRDVAAAELAKYVSVVFDVPEIDAKPTNLVQFARGLAAQVAAKETRTEANNRARHDAIAALFATGKGNEARGVRGTWWAAYNAVTEYLGSERPRHKDPASRIDSLTFGAAATTSKRALAAALAFAA